MKKKILFIVLLIISLNLFGQTAPFNIAIEPITISGLGGLQSFAFGQDNGKWLLVGGRLDGLHRRQPWASFDIAGHNNQLIVVDPVTMQKWSAPLTSLPTSVQEQLSSTNMNFFQEGDYLYIAGGYGYSATQADHTTFPNLAVIKVSDVINAIINNLSFTNHIRQITDKEFQVTGGKLKKINNVYHLLGGQKFLGRYNPMGPNHGPGFTQEYTNQIRRFTLSDDGVNITTNHLTPFTDMTNLHRRDYNAESQILPNGEEGITMFSGVFQQTIDLPFLNSVTVDSNNYTVNNSFQQFYNHYHCAVVPLYSSSNNEMHTVFFGGIAQYYDSSGVLVQDNDVPFVKTIARVTRDSNGNMAEFKLPLEMPNYLGAGSEFIPIKNIPHFSNEVLKLDEITADSTLIGYIFGGINSTDKIIFWINDGTQSSANGQIFKVYLTNQTLSTSTHDLNEQSNGTLQMLVYPNPNNGTLKIKYHLKDTKNVRLKIFDLKRRLIESKVLNDQVVGENTYQQNIDEIAPNGIFFISIETPNETATQKIIINE
ncbi:MAG: hypothetical protein Kapaf2KO_09860 [Candidatus Kapaibacteriales bacterium]